MTNNLIDITDPAPHREIQIDHVRGMETAKDSTEAQVAAVKAIRNDDYYFIDERYFYTTIRLNTDNQFNHMTVFLFESNREPEQSLEMMKDISERKAKCVIDLKKEGNSDSVQKEIEILRSEIKVIDSVIESCEYLLNKDNVVLDNQALYLVSHSI